MSHRKDFYWPGEERVDWEAINEKNDREGAADLSRFFGLVLGILAFGIFCDLLACAL